MGEWCTIESDPGT